MENETLKEAIYNHNFTKLLLKRPFLFFVVLPLIIFAFYQIFIATPRFQSQSKLIVKEPDAMATMDPSLALLSGFGMAPGSPDTELVKAFINSNDMLEYLEKHLSLSVHYKNDNIDFFSRLPDDASQEDLLAFYNKHTEVEIDEKSQVITVLAQAFDPDFAYQLNEAIVSRSEWYINQIGHHLAEEQLDFIRQEHELIDTKLRVAKAQLLSFQQRHNLLDPQAEGLAFQEITYQLEAQVASKRAELNALRSSMSDDAPMVINAVTALNSLEEQLASERARLTQQDTYDNSLPEDEQNLSVSMILSKFSEYKIALELALTAYTSSQVSLEKSRIEAYRQLKFLITVESPTRPEKAKFPEVFYNTSLFLTINIMLFGIARILIATILELRH
ncbi:MAG: lipopolysaccharide biosynthesis protein [Pseudomonadota bacterium]